MDTKTPLDPNSLFSAKDLVIVITGGGTGIGLAFTTALAATGAKKIYILGRRLEPLEEAARAIPNVAPLQADVSSPESLKAAVAKVQQETGYVDVLINNAGVTGPSHTGAHSAGTIAELSDVLLSDWDKWQPTLAINTAAVVGVSAAFLPLLDAANARKGWESGSKVVERARKRDTSALAEGVDGSDPRTAQIITVSSIAGFNRYITMGIAYSASKAGATHAAKMLSTLLAPWGIRSNVIAPGIYPSDMTKGIQPSEIPPERVPAGRAGTYEDISGLILYMVGRSGAYVNGNVQNTDGGRLAVYPATY